MKAGRSSCNEESTIRVNQWPFILRLLLISHSYTLLKLKIIFKEDNLVCVLHITFYLIFSS